MPIVGLFFPRVLLFVILLATDWFGRAYETTIWPLLGFLFMPYTTLIYLWAAIQTNGNVGGGWIVLIVIAVLSDLYADNDSVPKG